MAVYAECICMSAMQVAMEAYVAIWLVFTLIINHRLEVQHCME